MYQRDLIEGFQNERDETDNLSNGGVSLIVTPRLF